MLAENRSPTFTLRHLAWISLCTMAAACLSGPSHAQEPAPSAAQGATVYRCGTAYSHTPCAGAAPSSASSPSRTPRTDGPVHNAPLSVLHGSTQAPPGQATVYLCQSHAGAKFWAHSHCSQQQALLERMENVPASLSPQQRVQHAQAQWDVAQRNAQENPQPITEPRRNPRRTRPAVLPGTGTAAEQKAETQCQAYRARLEKIDTQARAGKNAQAMDQLRSQRLAIRTEMRAQGC